MDRLPRWLVRAGYVVAHRVRSIYRRVRRPITIGVRVLAWDGAGRVILVRHSYGIDRWYLPGGAVAKRETFVAAALRELREETGIEPASGSNSLDLLGVLTTTRDGWTDHVVLYELSGAEWGGVLPGSSSPEIAEIVAADPTDLPPKTSRSTRKRIQERLAGEAPRSEW